MNHFESLEQQALFEWRDRTIGKYPELSLLHAIPNGQNKKIAEAARMKREGLLSGVSDVMLPVSRHGYHGLYIELKIKSRGKVSVNQKWWITSVIEQGYRAIVCKGWECASKVILQYLEEVKK